MLEEPILKRKNKLKQIKNFIPFLSVICLIVVVVGISFAFFAYGRTGEYTHTITGGKLGVTYNEDTGNNITIANAYPLTDEEALTKGLEFEFSVTGYNESNENVYYAIEIVYGDDVTGKNRFLDSDMKLSFYENDQVVFENKIFDNLNNEVLGYGYVLSGTSENSPITNTYKLRIWINDNVLISNTPDTIDTTGKNVYSSDEFMNSYANFKININAEIAYDLKFVTYDLNGAEGTISPTVIGQNNITSVIPVRDGYNFLGWATTANAQTAEYQSGDAYSGDTITLYAVWQELPELYETVETSLASYLLADDGDARIVSGTATQLSNNYVWYSGKLWRIVALNNDGSIKLVTDENITTIAWGADATYEGSWMYQWLNEDFLDTLYNYKNLLVTDYKWNATQTSSTTKPAETTMVEGTIGLLNYYEYVKSYGGGSAYTTGYLNNGYFWWSLTSFSSSGARSVSNYGNATNVSNPGSNLYGARPSVNLKSNIEISCTECDGSKTKPYTIVGDITSPTANELINNRVSGEYVTFDNELYRIVSIENNITKITKVDYLRDSSDTVITKYFASSATYGKSTNTQNDNYWDYYLNNTWYNSIGSNYKNMLVSGTWYLGTVGTETGNSNHYKNAMCATSNTTETTKGCTKTSTVYNGYIGLGRIGEMFTSQIGEGYSTSSHIWTITPSSSSSVRSVYNDGRASNNLPGSFMYAVRPSINLKSTIKITGGLGTKESPFVISE